MMHQFRGIESLQPRLGNVLSVELKNRLTRLVLLALKGHPSFKSVPSFDIPTRTHHLGLDGGQGTGKSTLALLFQQLGYNYAASGASFRTLTYFFRQYIDTSSLGTNYEEAFNNWLNTEGIILLAAIRLISVEGRDSTVLRMQNDEVVYLDQSDLRTPEIDQLVSVVSGNLAMDQWLIQMQTRLMHEQTRVLVEGRGTAEAFGELLTLKAHLSVTPEVRFQRELLRWEQKEQRPIDDAELGRLKRDVNRRDIMDSQRPVGKLLSVAEAEASGLYTVGIQTDNLKPQEVQLALMLALIAAETGNSMPLEIFKMIYSGILWQNV